MNWQLPTQKSCALTIILTSIFVNKWYEKRAQPSRKTIEAYGPF